MKKTLAALAVLSAFAAGSAFAADVTLYGKANLGFTFTSVDTDQNGADRDNSFTLNSGDYSGSRFGLKGTEELGNGMKVAFVLENGFNADDGSLSTGNTIFDREAQVKLIASCGGEIALGRSSILALDAGSYGLGGGFSTFGTGWGETGNQHYIWGAGYDSRFSNMLTLASPEFAGFRVYAQYSFGDGSGDENKSNTNRYYGIGATYNNGGLSLTAVVDSLNKKSNPEWGEKDPVDNADVKDTVRAIVGGSYDFGVVKPYLSVAYFKDGGITEFGDIYGDHDKVMKQVYFDGFGVMLGADAPLFGGKIHGSVGYLDADSDRAADKTMDIDIDVKRWLVGVGYDYNLSKRTQVYGFAAYMQDKWEGKTLEDDFKPNEYQIGFGICHSF